MGFTLPSNWRLSSTSESADLTTRVLFGRGLDGAKEQAAFLQPDFYTGTFDPWLLPDIDRAVIRLALALERQESVAIYGDYDADGIPATALMLRGLAHLGFRNLTGYIPTRVEGYGLRSDRTKQLITAGCKVMVTVDTGITAYDEIAQLQDQGVDVIVTDHHEVIGDLPPAYAVVNPKREESDYPNRYLAGTAVAYKLLWALYDYLGQDNTYLKWRIDLVGLATIADAMPLTGENRVLAHYGLKVMRQTKNPGLRVLAQMSGIDAAKISAYNVMFNLAPRLNAPSRLGRETLEAENPETENISLALLVTEDEGKALELAAVINQLNYERQNQVASFIEQVEAEYAVIPVGGLVVYLPEAPTGVIGLIAGRIAETSGWPCLVMTASGDGEARGSGRSPTGLSLVELLAGQKNLLVRFGGHAQAAGWTLKESDVPMFIKRLTVALRRASAENPLTTTLTLDTWLQPVEANLANAEKLALMEPFGSGNPKPLFYLEGTTRTVYPLGRGGEHVKIRLVENYPDLVWFRSGERGKLPVGAKIKAAVSLEVNEYLGHKNPQLIVKEII